MAYLEGNSAPAPSVKDLQEQGVGSLYCLVAVAHLGDAHTNSQSYRCSTHFKRMAFG